ncbi:IS3 family transposase [Vagococcus acidifermentans]|uniref:IS3 family transposase n=1 Tax=Vagococcus acidifermentans TaxID=564710 RepID=UPI001B885D9D
MIFSFIQENKEQLSVVRACKYFNVSRAGYYVFCHRKTTALELENESLSALLVDLFKQHKGRYGARRLTFILWRDYQLRVSRRRITRLWYGNPFFDKIYKVSFLLSCYPIALDSEPPRL